MPAKRKRCDADKNPVDYESSSVDNASAYDRHPSKRSASNNQMNLIPETFKHNSLTAKSQKNSSKFKILTTDSSIFHQIKFILKNRFLQMIKVNPWHICPFSN